MQIGAQDASLALLVAAGQQAADDARQHVAAARRGHAGVACGVEGDMSVGHADGRIAALQDDIALQPLRQPARLRQPLVGIDAEALHAVELLGVGCEDDALGQLLHPGMLSREDVQCVSVGDRRTLCAPQLGDHGDGRLLRRAQTGTYGQRLEVVRRHGLREDRLLAVQMEHRLRSQRLQDGGVALRRVHRHLARPCPQTGPRGEDGGARHAVAAADDEGVAHRALVGEGVAGPQHGADLVGLGDGPLRVHLVDGVRAESDVEHLHLARELLVLGEEEAELQLLEGQRQAGADDVGPDVIRVVLAHQARRQVDADHLGPRRVDILHQRGEAPRQRLVKP